MFGVQSDSVRCEILFIASGAKANTANLQGHYQTLSEFVKKLINFVLQSFRITPSIHSFRLLKKLFFKFPLQNTFTFAKQMYHYDELAFIVFFLVTIP